VLTNERGPTQVAANSPADKGGLMVGDVLTGCLVHVQHAFVYD
jgi:S1-C subfamily serine protease